MNKIIFTAILFIGIYGFVSAQNQISNAKEKEVGLVYFIDSAFQYSPVVKDNENKLRYSELSLKQSIAELSSPKIFIASEVLFAPYLNNNGKFISANPSEKAIGYDAGITNGGLYSATVNASLPLFNSAGKKAYRNESAAQNESYNNLIELTKHELEQQVTDQYIICYLSELQKVYVQKAIELLENQKAVVKDLVVSGLAKQSDYLLIGIEIQNQKILLSQYQSEYSSNLLKLKSICGIKDTAFLKITSPDIEIQQLNDNSRFLKIYKTDSMQIIASQNIFNLKYKPNLSLYANGGLNAIEIPNIQRKFGISAGITFNWIIFDGKQKRTEQQKNTILLNTNETYKLSFLKQHELQKQNALNEIRNLDNTMSQKKQQLADFEQLLQLYKVQLGQGQLSVIDYLNTVRSYVDLKRDIMLAEANKLLIINEYNYLNW